MINLNRINCNTLDGVLTLNVTAIDGFCLFFGLSKLLALFSYIASAHYPISTRFTVMYSGAWWGDFQTLRSGSFKCQHEVRLPSTNNIFNQIMIVSAFSDHISSEYQSRWCMELQCRIVVIMMSL